ncbi:aspartic peptidase A1 [Mycena belliarum]|uniref:Aspartic peptidase A1 n=1 Tax=Mycena belliarum TaxID=1033014 RepID=A0AAD6U388_9AGAR|nr:aspartic peptidase A1 [Mycena belliae]
MRSEPTGLKLGSTVFLLFLLLADVCHGASISLPSTRASETSPFVSIPLSKLPGDAEQLGVLGSVLMRQLHVRRGVRRLALMRSRSPSLESNLARPISAPASRRRHAAIHHKRSLGDGLTDSEPDDGIQVPQPDTENTNDTSSVVAATDKPKFGAKPKSEEDAEITKSHKTTYRPSTALDIEANDIGYLATVLLGTPPKPFRLLVDSGSADMWVGGENCQADGGGTCGNHRFLGERSSSSFRDTGNVWNISYGSGQVSGTMVSDQVEIAGLELRNHSFGVARRESAQFTPDDIPLDGMLGCAKSILSKQQTPTLVEALRSAGMIARNIISYKIPRVSDGKNDGEIALGGMNPARYDASSVARVKNVNTGGFWEADLDAVKVNGADVKLYGRSCIFDTGTTLFIAPKEDVDVIHKSIPGARFDNSSNAWTVPCDTSASVSLRFGGLDFRIRPDDLAFLPLGSNVCTSAIAEGSVNEGPLHWLIGDTFLKNVYLSTDQDADIITLARLAD